MNHFGQAWRTCARASVLLMLVPLGGCLNGDFGRVKSPLVTDDMHAWVAADAPGRQNRPPSKMPLTDAERQLRDLAYPLIEPPYDRQRWYSVLAEYNVAGKFYDGSFPDRKIYAEKLLSTPVRSQHARYSKLIDDVRNDVVRIDPFYAVARYVITMDQKRQETMRRFPRTTADERSDARARIAENIAVIKWVQRSMSERLASFTIALEQLAVAAPSPMAAEAERSLMLLQGRIDGYRGTSNPAVAAGPYAEPSLLGSLDR